MASDLDRTDISLVIPAWNEADYLPRLLDTVDAARDRYRNGVGTHTEVLDAEALRTLTDRNHLNAHYDVHLARYRLQKAVGEL